MRKLTMVVNDDIGGLTMMAEREIRTLPFGTIREVPNVIAHRALLLHRTASSRRSRKDD